MGRTCFTYVLPEDFETVHRWFDPKQSASTEPVGFRLKLRRLDGSAVEADILKTPMHSAAGEFNGIICTLSVEP